MEQINAIDPHHCIVISQGGCTVIKRDLIQTILGRLAKSEAKGLAFKQLPLIRNIIPKKNGGEPED